MTTKIRRPDAPGAYWIRARTRGARWMVAGVSEDGAVYLAGDEDPLGDDDLDEVGPRLAPPPGDDPRPGEAGDAQTAGRAATEAIREIGRMVGIAPAAGSGDSATQEERVVQAVRARLARHLDVAAELGRACQRFTPDELQGARPDELREDRVRRDEILDRPVDNLELTVAATHLLQSAGVRTVRDLCRMTAAQVSAIPHASRKIVRCVEETLGNLGLSLARDPDATRRARRISRRRAE